MYNSQKVAERIKELARKQNVSVKQLLEEVGLGFNTMSNMKSSMPKADNLAKIADYLNCSTDYLLGRSDKPDMTITVNQTGEIIEASPINAINNTGQPLNEMTAELVKMFENMDFSDKMKVMNYVLDLKEKG